MNSFRCWFPVESGDWMQAGETASVGVECRARGILRLSRTSAQFAPLEGGGERAELSKCVCMRRVCIQVFAVVILRDEGAFLPIGYCLLISGSSAGSSDFSSFFLTFVEI